MKIYHKNDIMKIEINIFKLDLCFKIFFKHKSKIGRKCMEKGLNKYTQVIQKDIFKITTLILFLAIIFLGYGSIRLQQQLKDQKYQAEKSKQELILKNEELQLCSSDRAQVKKESKQIYSPQEFKISSPLFEGQEMIVKTLNYKGSDIKEMSIDLPQNDERGHSINIKVWDYVNVPSQKVARFNDYYSAFPLWTETLTGEEPAYYKYITSKGFSMRRSCGELSISKSITSIHSIHVVISGYQCTGIFVGQEEKTIRESTRYLEKVADTIVF